MKYTISLILLTLILLTSCSSTYHGEECFPEDIFNTSMVDKVGKETIKDMAEMMPEYNWTYYVDGTCLYIRGK